MRRPRPGDIGRDRAGLDAAVINIDDAGSRRVRRVAGTSTDIIGSVPRASATIKMRIPLQPA
jgi:hypothetical protein